MPLTPKHKLARLVTITALPVLLLVSGCANTTILSSSNPSRDTPRAWPDYDQLPVKIVGSIPRRSQADLASLFPPVPASVTASGRHIVLYVNASQLPAKPDLCSDTEAFRAGSQNGHVAAVTGALCDGRREVTRAFGDVRTTDPSPRWLIKGFGLIKEQLFQALYPEANDPSEYQQG